jgi:hypothetical protein
LTRLAHFLEAFDTPLAVLTASVVLVLVMAATLFLPLEKALATEEPEEGGLTVVVRSPVPPTPIDYPVELSFGTWSGTGDMTALVDGPLSKFVRLTANGIEIDSAYYTLSTGSAPISTLSTLSASGDTTLITLKEAYLKTLSPGTYNLIAEYTDGISDPIELIIPALPGGGGGGSKTPGTGHSAGILLVIAALAGSGSLLVAIGRARQRR